MLPFILLPAAVLLAVCTSAIPVSDQQQPLGIATDADSVGGRPSRGLAGHFLHITGTALRNAG